MIPMILAPFALMVNDGRTFKCTACGKCCTGSGEVLGHVWQDGAKTGSQQGIDGNDRIPAQVWVTEEEVGGRVRPINAPL